MQGNSTVRELAYLLWEARGRPEGSAERDWLEAERQLSASPSMPAVVMPEATVRPEAARDDAPAGAEAKRPRISRSKTARPATRQNPAADPPL